MHTFPSALATHIAQDVASLAFAYKLTLEGSATVLYFTTSPVDVVIDGKTYLAAMAVTPSSMFFSLGVQPAKLEISGSFDPSGITESNLMAGIYDFAAIEVYLFNWADLTMGKATMFKGRVSEIQIDGRQWTFECSDLLDQLTQNVLELTQATCRAELFDTRCKVRSAAPTWQASTACVAESAYDAAIGSIVAPTIPSRRWFKCIATGTTGTTEPDWINVIDATTADNGAQRWKAINALVISSTVTSKNSNQLFSDLAIVEDTNFWTYGKVQWLTGANAGRSAEIKSQLGSILELYQPMQDDIQVGDTFLLYAGCDKTKTTCKTKFKNIYNMRGEPDKPSNKLLSEFGER